MKLKQTTQRNKLDTRSQHSKASKQVTVFKNTDYEVAVSWGDCTLTPEAKALYEVLVSCVSEPYELANTTSAPRFPDKDYLMAKTRFFDEEELYRAFNELIDEGYLGSVERKEYFTFNIKTNNKVVG